MCQRECRAAGAATLNERSAFPTGRFAGNEKHFAGKTKCFTFRTRRFAGNLKRFASKARRFAGNEKRFAFRIKRFAGKESCFAGKEKRFAGNAQHYAFRQDLIAVRKPAKKCRIARAAFFACASPGVPATRALSTALRAKLK
jgi:hypothetical protein